MKLGKAIKNLVFVIVGFGFLVGMIGVFVIAHRYEPTGYYTSQDTLKAYNNGYRIGAQNMRNATIIERTDTTVKSCQQFK